MENLNMKFSHIQLFDKFQIKKLFVRPIYLGEDLLPIFDHLQNGLRQDREILQVQLRSLS